MTRTELAACNNAVWCDTMRRAHGAAGEFVDGLWRNPQASPPFHPNLVTLRVSQDPGVALDHARRLLASKLAGRWGIKDSFCTLELAELGFETVVDASWLWREPTRHAPVSLAPAALPMRWEQITSPAALADWEARWSGVPAPVDHDGRRAQFPVSLLAERDVVFLGGFVGPMQVAGAILNRTDRVVGLSNVFASAEVEAAAWTGFVRSAELAFPDAPLVGWEQGRSLDLARACGFEPVGQLRVWLRRSDPCETVSYSKLPRKRH